MLAAMTPLIEILLLAAVAGGLAGQFQIRFADRNLLFNVFVNSLYKCVIVLSRLQQIARSINKFLKFFCLTQKQKQQLRIIVNKNLSR